MVIEIYRAKDGFRWRGIVNRITCDGGEAYATKSSCKRAVKRLIESMKFVQVLDLTQKPTRNDQ